MCTNIYNNAKDTGFGAPGQYKLLVYSVQPCQNAFSISVMLNNGRWFCAGSSGASGEYDAYGTGAGCHMNP